MHRLNSAPTEQSTLLTMYEWPGPSVTAPLISILSAVPVSGTASPSYCWRCEASAPPSLERYSPTLPSILAITKPRAHFWRIRAFLDSLNPAPSRLPYRQVRTKDRTKRCRPVLSRRHPVAHSCPDLCLSC